MNLNAIDYCGMASLVAVLAALVFLRVNGKMNIAVELWSDPDADSY
ncbi:hypothetical protein [Tumebacillus permanentifrigoris]|uniref:Uncharacterized protein n=1 Tax=Tumebacillus permanentifrigoris TaxID=378543 RepID=A0A316D4R9_9BACL|nr:hypothetical protein [Tumebacillus permanentifrigoris]PWK05074.1 hypothetical protein C7459_1276 [Tumebacillus permanentifrigoris]